MVFMRGQKTEINRRNVLKLTGSAFAAVGASGIAGASEDETVEINVGYDGAIGRELAVETASDVVREFNFDALTIRAPAAAVSELEGGLGIRYVELNGTMEALAQSMPWGVDRVDADIAHANGETGDGADVAIIDTGIDQTHPDLSANVGEGKAFVAGTGTPLWQDDNGHGTHCAGIADAIDNSQGVVGVSAQATLHAVKVLTASGSGLTSDVAAGIEWTADQGYDVGSLSLGGGESDLLRDACTYAEGKGVLLVAAAGNSGPCSDCVGYPAAYDTVVAVSATTENDQLADFSSTGPQVELAAPGDSIYSTFLGGSYATLSGTSMACPHVSGAGAQLMANGYTNTEARQQLRQTAEDIGLSSNEQGSGLLDVAAALGVDGSDGSDGGGGTGDQTPTIDTLNVANRSNKKRARFDVEWAVSDADGDLESVSMTMSQDGRVADSSTVSVSGSSASGKTQLKEDGGSGTYDITLTVSDSNGNHSSQTKTVTA